MGSEESLDSSFWSLRRTSLLFLAIDFDFNQFTIVNYLSIIKSILNQAPTMNFWAKKPSNPFAEIQRLSQGLSHCPSHVALQKITAIFNSLFQAHNQSLLLTLCEQARRDNQQKWKAQFVIAIDLLGPRSQFGRALSTHKDVHIDINKLHYVAEFENYLKNSQLNKAQFLSKEDHTYRFNLLEFFFANLAICIPLIKQQERSISCWRDAFFEDAFYYHIVRNPILIIIRDWLTHAKIQPRFYQRILRVLDAVLLDDLAAQIARKERAVIRNSVLLGVYVTAEQKVGHLHWELLERIYERLLKQPNPALMTFWIKLNLTIIMNSTSLEKSAREALRQFDPHFTPSSRQYFASIQQVRQKNYQQDIDPKVFANFLLQVQVLIKQNCWQSSPLFLQTVFLLISIAEKLFDPEKCAFRLNFFKNYFKRGHYGLRSAADITFFELIEHVYRQKVPKLLEEDEEEEDGFEMRKGISESRRREGLVRQRKSLMVYRGKFQDYGVWMKPIQSRESYFLFQGAKGLSHLVDKVLFRKHPPSSKPQVAQYPITDLRWMASRNLFLWLFSIGVIIYLLY